LQCAALCSSPEFRGSRAFKAKASSQNLLE
jgi:hypothetical protein